jgi:multiple sugar transport system permease protein
MLTSLRTPEQIYSKGLDLAPSNLTLSNYEEVLLNSSLPTWLANSAVVAGVTSGVSVIVGILAAYALSNLRFRGSKIASQMVFFLYMLPTSLLFIPFYVILARVGLINTRWALIVSYPTFLAPFLTWVLLGYFLTIPRELIDAALIDGCSHIRAIVHVMLPLAKPAVVTSTMFGIAFSWNELLYAAVFLQSNALRTVPVGITSFLQMELLRWGPAMASAAIAIAPPVLLYMFMQESVVQGLTGGAVKG